VKEREIGRRKRKKKNNSQQKNKNEQEESEGLQKKYSFIRKKHTKFLRSDGSQARFIRPEGKNRPKTRETFAYVINLNYV